MATAYIEDRRGRGGGWRARYRGPDGKFHGKTFGRKVDAEAWLTEQKARLSAGDWIDPLAGQRPFADWFEVWLASKKRITARTRYDYEGIFRSRLAETFEHLPLNSIDRILVGGWIDAMIAEGLSPARIRKVHTVLSAALDAAVDAGLIGRNPARRAELPRIERRRKRFLSAAEVADLADAMPDRSSRVLVLVAAYGGLRWGELAALRRDRCDLLRRRIIVDTAISDVAGRLEAKAPKSHAARLVALPAFVADELARHLVDVAADPDALVFAAPQGGPLRYSNFRRRVWDGAVTVAGLDGLTPHELRHSCASLMHDAGADLVMVSRQLGHESPAVTGRVYVGLFDDAADEVMERLDRRHSEAAAPPARPERAPGVVAEGPWNR